MDKTNFTVVEGKEGIVQGQVNFNLPFTKTPILQDDFYIAQLRATLYSVAKSRLEKDNLDIVTTDTNIGGQPV